ncbi:MAG TPA: hypothetical protein VFB67_04000 [Candidatus Polarisedimenticolaceae bacterium]|nr:hypothetical protein [Candidatus Polarisedimenticolaceae bacterium]
MIPALLAAAAATLPPAVPSSTCPAALTGWTWSGSLESADEWDAILLELRGDRARITELTLRSQVPRLPVAEADWFVTEPLKPETASFTVATRVLSGKPLEELCAGLARGGLPRLAVRSSAELNAAEGALVIESKEATAVAEERGARVGLEIKPPDPRPPEKMPPIPYDEGQPRAPGQIAQPGLVATTKRTLERRDVTARDPDPDRPVEPERAAQDEAERKALVSARDLMVRQARSLRATAGDLIDIPFAKRMLSRLVELDAAALPKGLPGELILAVAGAPRDYVTALAIETLTHPESPDRLTALRWLGDQPAPDAIEDLMITLRRRSDAKSIQLEQALALRALLRAAPDQARLEALRLLTGPRRVVRAAMGVFWFTEPPLRRELSSVDFTSVDKVRAMAARIRGYLSVAAKDSELKRAAAALGSP